MLPFAMAFIGILTAGFFFKASISSTLPLAKSSGDEPEYFLKIKNIDK
jgi:hypothetical protein